MQNITKRQSDSIEEFFSDKMIDIDWRLRHTSIEFNDRLKSVTIVVDNMNEQEYYWLKEL